MDNYYTELQHHLWKCEIDYAAKKCPHGRCIQWLAEYCQSISSTSEFLRSIGFKIKDIVDDEPWPGEKHRWVETTSGIIVYVNDGNVKGLVARAAK